MVIKWRNNSHRGLVLSNLVSTTEASVDGLRSWNTVWNNGAGITNQSRTIYDAGNGNRYVTNIAPDNSWSVAITRYGTNVSVTAFAYDVQSRMKTMKTWRVLPTTPGLPPPLGTMMAVQQWWDRGEHELNLLGVFARATLLWPGIATLGDSTALIHAWAVWRTKI